MAFSDNDILKLAGSVLAAGVIDTNTPAQWYEKRNANSFIIDPQNVWSDLPLMKDLHAANFTQAVTNAVASPEYFGMVGINPDGTFNDDTALRMTPVAGTNNATYICYNEYNNPASGAIKNWIQPQLIPRPNGAASAAYQASIWIGKPSEGNLLLTSSGSDGNWVSHFWNPAGGLLLISPTDAPPSAVIPTTDLYITGFTYTGATGGGGGFSGSSILLQDPEGDWRITADDWPVLRFERREFDADGFPMWNTQAAMGASVTTDGITLTRPFNIDVDLSANNLNDSLDGSAQDLKSVFRVSGTDSDFIFSNSEQQTILETKRGTEVQRYDAVREEQEIENRPLKDLEIVLDTTDTPEADSVTELSWVSNINYDKDTDFIRFNTLGFDVLEVEGDTDSLDVCPIRISVEGINGELIQENISKISLDSGMSGGFDLSVGFNHYNIQPKYTDRKDAVTVTRIQLAKGHKVKLTGGMYTASYTHSDGTEHTVDQFVPRQKAKVEYINAVNVVDGSNIKDEIHKSSGIILEQGVNAYNPEFSEEQFPLVSTAEHTNAYMPVLGNYEDTSYIASGDGGVKVLFEDSTTRTQFWTEGDRDRLIAGATPQFWKEVTEIELPISGIFTSELNERGWDIVNTEKFTPLIRQENDKPIGYRCEIASTIVDYKFQESQDKFSFLDGDFRNGYTINPTIDVSEPEYVKLRLPRTKYTINLETPRTLKYFFSSPVKVYGYYKDPVDPADITTGTFVPSIKADVLRVFEESIISGDDLSDRLDLLEGQLEWDEATRLNLPTLHLEQSLQALADEDGEWLLWSDADSLYTDQDEHQWLFQTGQEAYFEPSDSQGSWKSNNTIFTFNPMVVHVPEDTVGSFDVSFGWNSSFNNNGALQYGEFTLYIITHGRGGDVKVTLNIPINASINWRFRQRRDGTYAYSATPHNDNLSSTGVASGSDFSNEAPEDPAPPLVVG
ncbi:putative coil containing protein [Vibrio phage 501E54-1]|nr:putative coil containing protein [Vibrio phage 501E54-1]